MDNIEKIRRIYDLKKVDRVTIQENRRESVAEHVFSTIMLAEFFMDKVSVPLDKLKVMRIILFHDLVEIEAGDTNAFGEDTGQQKEREDDAAERLWEQLPEELAFSSKELWEEYEKRESPEAKFAKAMDAMDPMFQALPYKENWHELKITEEKLRALKEPSLKEFPELIEFFEKFIEYFRANGYFV